MDKNKSVREILLFFGITMGLTYFVFWGPLALTGIPAASLSGASGPPWAVILFILGGFTPSLTAIILSWRAKSLGELFPRLNPFTTSLKWHVIILGVILIGTAGQILILELIGEPIHPKLFLNRLVFMLPLLILGPLSEELGWRGYALGRLQLWFNPFFSSLILGVIWSLWHFPLFHIVGTFQNIYDISFPGFLFGTTLITFIYTWFFNQTGGSIWSAVFFHWLNTYTMDTLGGSLVPPPPGWQWLQSIPYAIIVAGILLFANFGDSKSIKT